MISVVHSVQVQRTRATDQATDYGVIIHYEGDLIVAGHELNGVARLLQRFVPFGPVQLRNKEHFISEVNEPNELNQLLLRMRPHRQ
jgi:hypothetical protein